MRRLNMEREILFRGKAGNKWCFGYLIEYLSGKRYISDHGEAFPYEVIPETVGQYTGLTDRNGVKIFEGDVCRYQNVFSSKPHIGTVRYYADAKPVSDDGQYYVDLAECNPEDLEVIGNIHDNPELLKGEELV